MWNHGFFLLALLSMAFGLGGVNWFFEGFALLRKKRLIKNISTSKINSIMPGLVELKGIAKWKEEMYGPISGSPCVYYTYRIEQHIHRHGNPTWIVIGLGSSGENLFYIEDDSGLVLIDPLNSDISSPVSDTRNFPDYDSLPQYLKELVDNEKNQLLRRMKRPRGELMFTENSLQTDHEIYVLGTAEYQEEGKVVIKKGKEIPFFYISNRPEKEITRKMTWSAFRRLIGGPITVGICSFVLYFYYSFSLRYINRTIEISQLYKGWILFGPILALIGLGVLGYLTYNFTKTLIRSQGN